MGASKRLWPIAFLGLMLIGCSNTTAPINEWQHNEQGNFDAAFSPDKRYILIADKAAPASLWDIQTGQQKYQWQNVKETIGVTTHVAFSGDSQIAATVEAQTVVLWRVETGQPLTRLQLPVGINDVALSQDGQFLLLALQDRTAIYFDVAANQVRFVFSHEGDSVKSPIDLAINSVAISPDNRLGLTGGDDHTVRLWDLTTGQLLRQWQHGNHVTLVRFSHTGQQVLSAAANDQTQLWQLTENKKQATLTTSPLAPESRWSQFPTFLTTTTAVAYSADGQYWATGHPNQHICTWSALNGDNLACWQVPRQNTLQPGVVIQALMFSADGQTLYSQASNGMMHQWAFRHD